MGRYDGHPNRTGRHVRRSEKRHRRAADKAGLDKFRVVEKMEEPDGFAAVFSSLKVSIRERILRSESPEVYDMMKRVREALSQNGVSMYSDVRLDN